MTLPVASPDRPAPRTPASGRPRILIADDDANIRFGVRDFLEAEGFAVEEADSCAAAEEIFARVLPDAMVLDYQLPDGNAFDLLPRLAALEPDIPIVIVTGHGTVDLAVRALLNGAKNFLTKPVQMPALKIVLSRLIENRRIRRQLHAGEARGSRGRPDPFVGGSPEIHALRDEARRALETDSPVLIQGETGSGKGVLAAWMHREGPRATEAFVDLNCAGLSHELLDSELFGHAKGAFTGAVTSKPGLLEVAHRGTVFLDEVGDLDPVVQGKLLKILEEKRLRRVGDVRDRQVDIRLIAATHQDLSTLVREHRFREDLYYRLSVIPLRVPALRERREDIVPLACELLAVLAGELGRGRRSLSTDAEQALLRYDWPGNIRELRNVLERASLRSRDSEIQRCDLALEAAAERPLGEDLDLTLGELERRHISRVLDAEGGHVERAASRLGIPRSSLYQKIRQLEIRSRR